MNIVVKFTPILPLISLLILPLISLLILAIDVDKGKVYTIKVSDSRDTGRKRDGMKKFKPFRIVIATEEQAIYVWHILKRSTAKNFQEPEHKEAARAAGHNTCDICTDNSYLLWAQCDAHVSRDTLLKGMAPLRAAG